MRLGPQGDDTIRLGPLAARRSDTDSIESNVKGVAPNGGDGPLV
jgi:hypothetical protein